MWLMASSAAAVILLGIQVASASVLVSDNNLARNCKITKITTARISHRKWKETKLQLIGLLLYLAAA